MKRCSLYIKLHIKSFTPKKTCYGVARVIVVVQGGISRVVVAVVTQSGISRVAVVTQGVKCQGRIS
jgi:hypothetical protein